MHNKLKLFIKTSGVFFIGNALSKLIVFLLLPLYTNYISVESYGSYDLSIAYITVFTSLLYFDIWATVLRYMYDANDNKKKEKAVAACWTIFLVSSAIYLILGTAICVAFSINYAALILLYGLSINIHNMCSFVARGWKRNVQFAVAGIINTLVMVIGNLVMILLLHMEIEALYIAAILGNVSQAIYLCCVANALPKINKINTDKILLAQIMRYTLPLCLNSVAYWLLTSYNRVVIQNEMGIAANGLYAIGNKFGAAIGLITTCFTYAWQDLAFAHASEKKEKDNFYGNACGYYFLFLGIGFSLLMPFFSLLFPYLIGKNYQEAYSTIPLFLLTAILSAFSVFVGNIFYAIKDTKSIFISTIISCVCNLLLCRFLITLFGIDGANLSVCISFIINIILRYIILRKKVDIKINLQDYAIPCVLVFSASVVYSFQSTMLNVIYSAVLIAAIGVGAFLWKKKRLKLRR